MVDILDRTPQGDPETVVLLPDGTSLIGLHIRGLAGLHMLGIKEDAEGRPIAFAAADPVLRIDTMISNPRRHIEDEDAA